MGRNHKRRPITWTFTLSIAGWAAIYWALHA